MTAYNTQPFFSLKYTDEVIAAYMSVIPLVAGSIGAVVGGLISDLLVKNRGPYTLYLPCTTNKLSNNINIIKTSYIKCQTNTSSSVGYLINGYNLNV